MHRKVRSSVQPLALTALLGALFPGSASAQVPSQPLSAQGPNVAGAVAPRRIGTAIRTAEAPALDGVLDDRAWQAATPLTDFVQSEPLEGQAATEKTEVRILFDDTAIYIGVICYDSDPTQVIVTDSRRDSSLGDADSFMMILDTYHDRQSGFVFGTNAAGIQYDAQVRDEGQTQTGGGGAAFGGGGRAQAGSGGGSNVNWDGSWEVKARISDIGWAAEFRIPLRTLRYGPPPQTWGMNFTRNIRRKREQVFWSPLPQQYTLNRLSLAGDLRGLNLAAPRNFTVTPYAVGSVNRDFKPGAKNDRDGNLGFDTKFGVTPSMNLDVTYRTDFAQVEVDEQQINLTRFNLVFPEKRPFFLENAGLFSVGKAGDVDLFFSRSIGIADNDSGDLVPIVAGARLSGKASGLNVGFLNIQTEDVGDTPANNFTAARVNKELPNRSSVGAMFAGRVATSDSAIPDDWNRTWGVDGRLGLGDRVTFNGFAAKTETPGLAGRQYAFNGGVEYRDRIHRTYYEYGRTGEDFNPEVGFLRRTDGSIRMSTGWYGLFRTPKIREMGFRELFPHVTYIRYEDLSGQLETATLHMDNHFDWENGNYLAPGLNIQWEGLREAFEIYPGIVVPPGQYQSPHTVFRMNTDRRKALSGSFDWDYGQFLSGNQNNMSPALIFRKGGNLNMVFRWTRNNIDLPQGAFQTNLATLRATYNFTTSLFAQTLIQYNDLTERWSTNLRFNWLRTANTGLFVVYNDTEAFNGLGPINRAFIIKYSRQIELLR